MPRPLSATDDDIMEAAQKVLALRGSNGFSVSEVARELSLSRTAITLRFKSAQNLKQQVLRRNAELFKGKLGNLKLEKGAAGLIEIAELIGGMTNGRQNFSDYMARYASNVNDPDAMEIEQQRGQILREAILAVMPETTLPPEDAADAFMAHLTGSLMNWQGRSTISASSFLRERTIKWLRLVGISGEQIGITK
ncbi:TetR/AcrR family transcriptional regulator [Parasphingorhabdus sp.]|uniref:TetR/AcrR family transcriptional regulator n=1 Tax=Parasphingorhabdus sp. TaxID=2709688 RepID=UPI003A905215